MKEKASAKALRDLAAILVVATTALVVAFDFDVFEEFQRWAQRYERWQIDELVVVPLVFGLAFGFYFWRRWKELKVETSRREEAQSALEESEQRFRSLVQNAKDTIMVMNADGTVGYLNPAVEEMLGYKPEDIVGTDSFTPVHPDDDARVQGIFANAMSNPGVTLWMQLRLQHADGSWRHIETHCTSLLHDPTVRGIVVNSRDLTERRQAEEALRESEERFRLLAENAQDVVFRTRLQPTRQVEYISPSVKAMTGYEPEEYYADPNLGRRLVYPEDRQMLEETLRSTSGSPIALRWIRKDGRMIWTEQRNNPIYDEAGEIVAIEGIARDITERKRAEEKLQESEANLAEAQRIARLGSWEYAAKEGRAYWSDETYRIFGFTPQQFVPTVEDFSNVIHPDDRMLVQEDMAQLLRGEQLQDGIEFRIVRVEGEVRCVQGQRGAELDETGGLIRMFGTVQDITKRKRAEEALRESEERYRAVVQQAVEGMLLFDLSTKRILEANDAYQVLLGYDAEEMLGLTLYDVVAHDRKSIDFHVQRVMDKGNHVVGERCHRRKDGLLVEVEVTASLISYGGRSAMSVVVHDVTERKRAEEALRESEARYRVMLDASPDLVFRVSRDGEYLDFHASDQSMLYVPAEEIIGKNLRDMMPLDLVPPMLRRIIKALDTGEMQVFEYQLLVAGGIRDFEARLVAAGSGEVMAIVRDATERKVLERRLEHRAFHDSLTGLPNRALFLDRLEHALARAGRHRESVAVLFVDLDNFKVVNDSLGHEAGDALLVAVAERLREILRPEDTLARLSGDEFTVLLEDVEGTSDATVVAERIAVALRDPFVLEGQEAFVTASIGTAFGGSSQESPGALLRNADLAMYRAKETGKARHEVFRPEMSERALKRLSLEREIRRALDRDELRVHYQPQVLLSTELQEHLRASGRMTIVAQKPPESPRIVGMEALVRWEHPERGLLPPDEFVPFAEENGLIVSIGRWVLEEACRQAREWQEQHPSGPQIMMSVNVSAAQFRCPELVEDVARVLQETGLEAGMLTLEITEGVLLKDAQANADTLERLKGLGVRLAIDDFGTGYSSLAYLKRLPVDYLKIDRSFVTNLERDSKDRLLVSGVIYLAHGLGLKVIAEGVEKAEQLAQLQQMGCDMAQGYYFSRPLASEAATLLASNSETSLGY